MDEISDVLAQFAQEMREMIDLQAYNPDAMGRLFNLIAGAELMAERETNPNKRQTFLDIVENGTKLAERLQRLKRKLN